MAKKKVNIKIMEFDKWLGSQGALGQRGTYTAEDDIDGIMREAQKMKVQRIRTMELDKYLLQSEQELEKLKRGESLTSTGGPLPSNADFLNMAKALEELSPEEAQRVRSSYTFFKMAEKGGGGGMALMPMLLNYAKTNPGASEDQMINYLKLMDSQLLKGLELAKAMNPVQSEDSTLKFLSLMKELVIEGVRNPVLQAIEKSQPTLGFFDQIMTNPDLWSRFKEIGMFGGSRGNAATGEFDLKIEQLRSTNQLELRKLDLENRKMMLERESNDRRTDIMLSFLAPLSAMVAGPVSQRMQQLGHEQGAARVSNIGAHRPLHNPGGNPAIQPNVIRLECSCGYVGDIRFDGRVPEGGLKCPDCSKALYVEGTVLNESEQAGISPASEPSSVGSYGQPGR